MMRWCQEAGLGRRFGRRDCEATQERQAVAATLGSVLIRPVPAMMRPSVSALPAGAGTSSPSPIIHSVIRLTSGDAEIPCFLTSASYPRERISGYEESLGYRCLLHLTPRLRLSPGEVSGAAGRLYAFCPSGNSRGGDRWSDRLEEGRVVRIAMACSDGPFEERPEGGEGAGLQTVL